MSQNPRAISSSANYQLIFDNALEAYKKKTGKDLASDPLLTRLESCDSPNAVLALLRDPVPGFDQSGSSSTSDGLTEWLDPTVNVLYTFSSRIGSTLSLAYPPAGVIFTGIASLLSAAQGVSAIQGALMDIFERIKNVFRRIEIYLELPPTTEMTDIIVKVMIEVLLIFALVTKEIKQGKLKRFFKKVAGRSDIEDSLRRLDKLTQEEHRMTSAQGLRATHYGTEKIRGELCQVAINVDDQKRSLPHSCSIVAVETQLNQLRHDLTNWLKPPDPYINYNTASDAHHEGTGVWFTESTTFQDWKESSSLLWIHGKPGAGKSVLTSAIIKDINTISNAGSAHMAIFFFDFKDIGKQDARGLLSSLIVQLSNRTQSFYHILFDFYSAHEKGSQQPSIGALTKCLEDMLKATGDVPIYIIIDALDECPNTKGIRSSRHQVLALLKNLVESNLIKLRVCITSRPEVDIRTSLEPLTSTHNCISLHGESGQRMDIIKFVRAVVYSDENMQRWRDEDKELVIKTLSERADGMFRWVVCQLEVLRQCFPSSVRSILAELPESLDETYDRILQQIPKSNRGYAHCLLQCLVVAVRPLSVEELAEVLAIDFSADGGTPMVDEKLRWEDKEQAVLSACSTLIAVVDDWGSRRVQFSHFSVKEFLTSDRLAASTMDDLRYHHIRLESAHTIMAQACLGVLLRLDNNMEKETIESYPLARYAGKHFGDHVEFEKVLSHVTDGVDDLLDPDKPHFEPWLWLQIGDWNPRHWPSPYPYYPKPGTPGIIPVYPPRVTPLYCVAAVGPLCLAHRLILKHPEDLHVKDNKGYIPLQIAVLAGKDDISQLLIEYSADLDIQDIEGRTLLHMAAYKGLFKVAETLLQPDGAVKKRVNARNKKGQTALHLASEYHYPRIVALLLKVGLDVDAQDNDNMTPLLLALGQYTPDNARATAVAQLLLEHGASVHVRNKNGQTPLHLASERHHFSIVALLLKLGADVDVHNNDNMTPLLLASGQFALDDARGTAAAQVLLDHGASVHVQNENGQTPLHLASQGHLPGMVALLLRFRPDVDAQDNDNMTPLLLASGQIAFEDGRSTAAAQALLEHGASVHRRSKNGQTPLHLASQHGLSGMVALLLKFGADMDAQDHDNMTPLHFAVHLSSEPEPERNLFYDDDGETMHDKAVKVITLLLKHGVNVQVQNNNRETPLQVASGRGDQNPGVIRLLSEHMQND